MSLIIRLSFDKILLYLYVFLLRRKFKKKSIVIVHVVYDTNDRAFLMVMHESEFFVCLVKNS